MRVREAGERALLVELDDLTTVHAVAAALRAAAPAGLREVVPAYRSVLVAMDDPGSLDGVRRLLGEVGVRGVAPGPARTVELPVVYDGPDLAEVAQRTGLPADEVVRRHTAVDYAVAFLGFAPGFPYLVGLDPALHVPRRATPRTRVPAGSVGLAGEQTGVYPQATPGGWQLIGRTEAVLFDPARTPPALLSAGDRLRFVAVPP